MAAVFLRNGTPFVKAFPSKSILRKRQQTFLCSSSTGQQQQVLNLLTIDKQELEHHVVSWGHSKYRAKQVWTWIHNQGVTSPEDMRNLPRNLRSDLQRYTKAGSLQMATELVSKDGTRKRAYRLFDGQLIESVLMPYEDGRYTACISSQAGCAMGCVFCATGQMGFARQLQPEEIYEQVARFASELALEKKRLSNVVFMGMGEPLANYRNVAKAVHRITNDLGIGARKITISTVGVVPSIRKLTHSGDFPQVRLAVSLHCASDQERTALLPANGRYGGLDELMMALKDYVETTNRRLTLEWALIEGQNDDLETAQKLGSLVKRFGIRRDMVHVNVIPLNPTGGYGGSPSSRKSVNAFCECLEKDFGIACTPRVRRGIDIDAGCGQLKSKVQREEERQKREELGDDNKLELVDFMQPPSPTLDLDEDKNNGEIKINDNSPSTDVQYIDLDLDDYDDPEFTSSEELLEAERLIQLVQQGSPSPSMKHSQSNIPNTEQSGLTTKTTSIVDPQAIQNSKRRRKKLLRNLKQIQNLRDKQDDQGWELNEEQLIKLSKEEEWKAELESLEHNLK
eukprot:CAMPEP_0178895672 /NCGR_PEP_ID=MMETSP0786-20121207/720_1 /TAXON_ID=186022 /ORGANISM="Thalassionema frauenfeldii, Strain CCMP 1798" /LENGTH=567 /DNA_ID=CAMNT_0020565935 /DNA_START=125 /DNA_END=1828 /DNA_ORIENTATION=+